MAEEATYLQRGHLHDEGVCLISSCATYTSRAPGEKRLADRVGARLFCGARTTVNSTRSKLTGQLVTGRKTARTS